MSRLTASEAAIIDNSTPDNEKVAFGTKIRSAEQYGLAVLSQAITADATGALSITVPFACRVIDVIVTATAASGSGTVTLRTSTTAISDAIVCAVDTTVVRAGTLDDAYTTLAAGDNLNVITNGAADRGVVDVLVVRAD